MLPGAVAYTYLGFAGREAVAGGEGLIQKGLIALALLAAAAFLPRLVARLRQGPMLPVAEPVAEPVGEQGHIAGAAKSPPDDPRGRIEALDADPKRPVQQILAPRDATLPTVRDTEPGAESRPRISVVVPALNEAAIIAQTLADLAPLRALGHELILVDGGSSDATRDLAAPLVDRVLEAPRGRARQLDAGARVARGDWLWFLHADTRVPPPALEALLGACRAPTDWGRFNVRLSGAAPALRVIERAMNARSRLTGIATGDQGVFVARAAYDAVGGFPQIPLMEDIALSRLLRRRQRPLCLRTPLIVSSRRWEQRGIGRTVLLMWRLRLAYALGADPQRLAEDYGR
jgi:rSAM/selenodomain-associated transferase 2